MVSTIHNLLNPTHLTRDKARRNIKIASIGEQEVICTIDAIGCGASRILSIASVSQEALSQATVTLAIGKNSLHLGVAENALLLNLFILKNIVLHIVILLIHFVFGLTRIFQCLANNSIDSSLLLFGQGIKHFADRLFRIGPFLFFFHRFFLLVGITLLVFRGSMDHNIFVVVGIEFGHIFAFVIMCHDNVYVCARVSPCENETEFSNFAMKYFTAILFKLISPNGERTNISMTHKLLGKLTIFAVIKEAISINALITILENCVAENSIGVVVLVVPNQ